MKSLILFLILLLITLSISQVYSFLGTDKTIKSGVFLSPKLVMNPGSVISPYLFDIDFPKGHIGIKSFDAEVVDETGKSVPLHETYLHHWVVQPYYVRKDLEFSKQESLKNHGFSGQDSLKSLEIGSRPDYKLINNGGLCRNMVRHYFGLGSETRNTSTYVPDPYAIEIGNPEETPDGYEVKWILNIHAIDTRGVEDRVGCIECLCDLYNVTVDEFGRTLRPDYKGGLYCCYHKTQCRLKSGFDNREKTRTLYLKYTVRWVEWNSALLPAKVYILDVTDSWEKSEGLTGVSEEHHCHVEYEVKPCRGGSDECVDLRKKSLMMPFSGYIVYGIAHQHAGGIGAALYREDGETICSSIPKYGNGDEAGNEAGYIVGMSSCYPKPMKVSNGETLTVEFNYSNAIGHTGVMGLFYFLVAEQLPESTQSLSSRFQPQVGGISTMVIFTVAVAAAAMVVIVAAAVVHRRQNRQVGYEPLST